MGLNDLPNELIIEIFTYLPVYSIFQVRAVSKKWCGLVAATPIDPVRRALLKLYLKAITSPVLLDTQPEVISYAAEFDGEAYASSIEALTRRPLPEAFHMWLLEWPAHAVIKRLWPGLPSVCKNIVRFGGVCLFPQPDLELQKFSLKLEDNKYALHFEVADWDDGNDWVCGIPMYYEQDQKVMWRMYLLLSGKGKGETLVGGVATVYGGHTKVEGRATRSMEWLDSLHLLLSRQDRALRHAECQRWRKGRA
ncbi:hypothetical protein SCP_0200470 [Sparassis crispa]|uniref:F-box domain-containing protein n=1 Tax=Sparassis crispa TaxID=139825 RepID=A0A401G9K5_9APHY|nr:hypothetical protein SCP_0200470 [Sparassis crispa]GBE78850.1 hypothetical protein SCP_0200470 [Sparassis crispa]